MNYLIDLEKEKRSDAEVSQHAADRIREGWKKQLLGGAAVSILEAENSHILGSVNMANLN